MARARDEYPSSSPPLPLQRAHNSSSPHLRQPRVENQCAPVVACRRPTQRRLHAVHPLPSLDNVLEKVHGGLTDDKTGGRRTEGRTSKRRTTLADRPGENGNNCVLPSTRFMAVPTVSQTTGGRQIQGGGRGGQIHRGMQRQQAGIDVGGPPAEKTTGGKQAHD